MRPGRARVAFALLMSPLYAKTQGTEHALAAAVNFYLFLGAFILLAAIIGIYYLIRRTRLLHLASIVLNSMSLALTLYMVLIGTGDKLPPVLLLVPATFLILAIIIRHKQVPKQK